MRRRPEPVITYEAVVTSGEPFMYLRGPVMRDSTSLVSDRRPHRRLRRPPASLPNGLRREDRSSPRFTPRVASRTRPRSQLLQAITQLRGTVCCFACSLPGLPFQCERSGTRLITQATHPARSDRC